MSRRTAVSPLGVVDHMGAADVLLDTGEQLGALQLRVSTACGTSHSTVRKLGRVLCLLEQVRGELSTRGFRDHPKRFSTYVYFPRKPELTQE